MCIAFSLESHFVESYVAPKLPQTWEEVEPIFIELKNRPIGSLSDLEAWLKDRSDIESLTDEKLHWDYIHFTANSSDEKISQLYQYGLAHIVPNLATFEQVLNKKLMDCPYTNQLDPKSYAWLLKKVRNDIDIYRDDNVVIQSKIDLLSQSYTRVFSEMLVNVDGKPMTMQQVGLILDGSDRQLRERAYREMNERFLRDANKLEELFEQLFDLRQTMAKNAGFNNFRDFAFQEMGRFDYSPEDCFNYHSVIRDQIVPVLDELYKKRRTKLIINKLRPWDLNADSEGCSSIHPFSTEKILLQKSLICLEKIDPAFASILNFMQKEFLDIGLRPGKRPGGYTVSLQATRMPFLFMNAVNSMSSLRVFMHESGHAIHFFYMRDKPLLFQRKFIFEVAELMAMTMELLSMDHWDCILDNAEELRRAKIAYLEIVLRVLPWIATIDCFQHWMYTHPQHTKDERRAYWIDCFCNFIPDTLDYSDLHHCIEYAWLKQLHLFETPFYFIEYGFAQLGAIAMWRNYRQDPIRTINALKEAMKLGSTCSILEIYATAGINFEFSQQYVNDLAIFVKEEINKL